MLHLSLEKLCLSTWSMECTLDCSNSSPATFHNFAIDNHQLKLYDPKVFTFTKQCSTDQPCLWWIILFLFFFSNHSKSNHHYFQIQYTPIVMKCHNQSAWVLIISFGHSIFSISHNLRLHRHVRNKYTTDSSLKTQRQQFSLASKPFFSDKPKLLKLHKKSPTKDFYFVRYPQFP